MGSINIFKKLFSFPLAVPLINLSNSWGQLGLEASMLNFNPIAVVGTAHVVRSSSIFLLYLTLDSATQLTLSIWGANNGYLLQVLSKNGDRGRTRKPIRWRHRQAWWRHWWKRWRLNVLRLDLKLGFEPGSAEPRRGLVRQRWQPWRWSGRVGLMKLLQDCQLLLWTGLRHQCSTPFKATQLEMSWLYYARTIHLLWLAL